MERPESPTSSTRSDGMGGASNSFASPHSIPTMPSLSPLGTNNLMVAQASRSARGVSQPSAGGASVAYYNSSSMVAFSTNNLCSKWQLQKPVSYRVLTYPLKRGPGYYKLTHVGPAVRSRGSKVTPYQCHGCQMDFNVTVVYGDREAHSYYSDCDPNLVRDLGDGKQHNASCVFTTPIKERHRSVSRGTGPERRSKKQPNACMGIERARQRHNHGSSMSVKESLRQSTSKDCVPHGNQGSGGFQIDPMATIFVSSTHTVRSFRSSEDHLAFEKWQKSIE